MTEKDLRGKLSTTTGMREVAEELAQVWWDRIDLDDAEEAYIEMSIVGCVGIMDRSTDDIIELCIDAEMVEEVTAYCPECKTTFHDEDGCTAATDEMTSLADHGRCHSCQKKWQNGELEYE